MCSKSELQCRSMTAQKKLKLNKCAVLALIFSSELLLMKSVALKTWSLVGYWFSSPSKFLYLFDLIL